MVDYTRPLLSAKDITSVTSVLSFQRDFSDWDIGEEIPFRSISLWQLGRKVLFS